MPDITKIGTPSLLPQLPLPLPPALTLRVRAPVSTICSSTIIAGSDPTRPLLSPLQSFFLPFSNRSSSICTRAPLPPSNSGPPCLTCTSTLPPRTLASDAASPYSLQGPPSCNRDACLPQPLRFNVLAHHHLNYLNGYNVCLYLRQLLIVRP